MGSSASPAAKIPPSDNAAMPKMIFVCVARRGHASVDYPRAWERRWSRGQHDAKRGKRVSDGRTRLQCLRSALDRHADLAYRELAAVRLVGEDTIDPLAFRALVVEVRVGAAVAALRLQRRVVRVRAHRLPRLAARPPLLDAEADVLRLVLRAPLELDFVAEVFRLRKRRARRRARAA